MEFKKKLATDKFLFTAEIFPPRGIDTSIIYKKIEAIKNYVDAINITDNQLALMRVSSLAVSRLTLESGVEPIFQITCRDRNRLALQSDLLGAGILGIKNVLILRGDYPTKGEYPEAKPVYDLTPLELISVAKKMNQGYDLKGNPLKGAPNFCIGAAAIPYFSPLQEHIDFLLKKVEAGVDFFQTQPIFSVDVLTKFRKHTLDFPVPILIGVFVFKSFEQALGIKSKMGIEIPDDLLFRLRNSHQPLKEGIKIAQELIKEIKNQGFKGAHLMALGAEEYIGEIICSK